MSVCYLYKQEDVGRGQWSVRNKNGRSAPNANLSPLDPDSPNLPQLASQPARRTIMIRRTIYVGSLYVPAGP